MSPKKSDTGLKPEMPVFRHCDTPNKFQKLLCNQRRMDDCEVTNSSCMGSTEQCVFTVGHSTRTAQEFVALLTAHGVTILIDVRTVPRSRTNPQFNKDTLPITLSASGIRYEHFPALGGLRKPEKDSINAGWRNLSFRGYADHMQTVEFRDALDALIQLAKHDRPVLMCAEAVPWRCHRSLIADALTIRRIRVEELSSRTCRRLHQLRSFAKVFGDSVIYPAEC